MNRDILKEAIDNIPEKNLEPLFTLLLRFVEEDDPLPDEIEALNNADAEYVPFDINEYI